jgi:hypothetical protein
MDSSIEARFKTLERTIEKQTRLIQKLDDVYQIQNLMSRYIYMHEVGKDPEFIDTIFAQQAPDISWEVAHMGYFKGKESVRRVLDAHGIMSKGPGKLFMHTLTTPCIEIAADGKTGKGLWISPGAETIPDPNGTGLIGGWAWTKYGCDFIKENGVWKLWHYHVYRVFLTPADKNYSDEFETKVNTKGGTMLDAYAKKDGGPSYDNPYTRTFIDELVPAPPEPYETFDKTFSYGPD